MAEETFLTAFSSALNRIKPIKLKDTKGFASVLIPICIAEDGHVSILYTKRSTKVGTHRGEVSFPGGRKDETDIDATFTALREANEEIGLAPSSVRLLGQLEDVPSLHNVCVTPVIGYLGSIRLSDFQRSVSAAEIDEIFTVPLRDLRDPARISYDLIRRGKIPRYLARPDCPIWGLTAYVTSRVLSELSRTEAELSIPATSAGGGAAGTTRDE